MGGKGSGGRRPGAGRKPKDAATGALLGSRRAKARAKQFERKAAVPAVAAPGVTTSAAAPDVAIPTPPGNLTLDELAVWNELAPLAEREGTLTDSTRMALRDLCEAIVLKRRLLRVVDDEGVTIFNLQGAKAAHPLLTQFRGLMQRVEAGMLRFKLAPIGKEILQPREEVADPFAQFDSAEPDQTKRTTH